MRHRPVFAFLSGDRWTAYEGIGRASALAGQECVVGVQGFLPTSAIFPERVRSG